MEERPGTGARRDARGEAAATPPRESGAVRRTYEQPCSFAGALDRIGERWSLLIVRELSLGPLRFSDLARDVGGAPTDVLTRRLRSLEADGIVERRRLEPPASADVYELTGLGRELERPMLELGRWGLNFFDPAQAAEIGGSLLPNALRVLLRPPSGIELTVEIRSEGQAFALEIRDGWIAATRGPAIEPDLTLSGPPLGILAAATGLVPADGPAPEAEIGGDPAALEALRSMLTVPEGLRERLGRRGPATPRTS